MKTKRNRLIVLLCLCLQAPPLLYAQVLYQVSGNGAMGKSYILATEPLAPIEFLDTIPNLFKVFSECNKVVTEFTMEDFEAIAALRQAALLPDSVRLKNFFSEAEYKQIDEALTLTLGMGLKELGRMKPSYLTELYRNEILKKWAGYDDLRSSEHFFERVAQTKDMPVYGLDGIGETLYMLFDREPFEWQCTELKNIIESPELEVRQAKMLHQLYTQGRLLDMAYQVNGPDNKSSVSYSDYQVYAKRNKVWVKRLNTYLKDGGAFITLNAIYLGGDDGLLKQLSAAGYRIRPVNRKAIRE